MEKIITSAKRIHSRQVRLWRRTPPTKGIRAVQLCIIEGILLSGIIITVAAVGAADGDIWGAFDIARATAGVP